MSSINDGEMAKKSIGSRLYAYRIFAGAWHFPRLVLRSYHKIWQMTLLMVKGWLAQHDALRL